MKSTINYISELNCFHRWLETYYLPPLSQLLWYRLMALFNQSGWETEIIADNATLMQLVGVKREATFIAQVRRPLLENRLLLLYRGRKGHPNRYRLMPLAPENDMIYIYQDELKLNDEIYQFAPTAQKLGTDVFQTLRMLSKEDYNRLTKNLTI